MQTRRDLYQAHKLMMQRVGLALLQGEPDIAESPMRRLSVAAFSGAMVAVLIAAIFGVLGLLSPGGARGLDSGDKIIIEKETGTKYVYDTNGKRMLPVLNYASAKLALNASNPEQRVVSRKSLAKFVRGPMIGIPGAPDSLPDPDHLVKKPWSVCVRNGSTKAGGTGSVSSLVAGRDVGGRPVPTGQAVAVQSGGQIYAIWNNQRMKMTLPPAQAANITNGPATEVKQTWLSPIEQGTDFAPPAVTGRGERVRAVSSTARVGQVYTATLGGTTNWYVLLKDGFARISHTQAQLLLAEPQTATMAYPGQQPAALQTTVATAGSRQSSHNVFDAKLPPTLPNFVNWDGTTPLCYVYSHTDTGSVSAQLTIGGTLPSAQATDTAGTTVDQVVLPPGGASLVGILPGAGQLNAINTWSIVNDAGISFPLQSKDVVQKLGYDVKNAAPVPKQVMALIPTGPTLDPKAATNPVPTPTAHG
jgi:ESX secretion system ATPase EccB